MASGSFEIDTYTWFRSLPLDSCTSAYSTGTLFAVGECAFLKPYTFYQYQSTVGFVDTSTLSNALTSTFLSQNQSTTASLLSNIDYNRREFVSTVPLMRWISSSVVETYPFYYQSTFLQTLSTVQSTIQSTSVINFISSGNFGTITSNVYPTCSPYSLYSTIPITISTFSSTIVNLVESNFISTLNEPSLSSIAAPGYVFDFTSTISSSTYPLFVQCSNVWLGEELQSLIDSKKYNVFVDCQYSIYVSTNTDSYTWISSVGAFGWGSGKILGCNNYVGRTTVSRIGNMSYTEVHTKQMFVPEPFIQETQLATFNSNYYMNINLLSSASISAPGDHIYADIFVPGENNFTFTLVPLVSTLY